MQSRGVSNVGSRGSNKPKKEEAGKKKEVGGRKNPKRGGGNLKSKKIARKTYNKPSKKRGGMMPRGKERQVKNKKKHIELVKWLEEWFEGFCFILLIDCEVTRNLLRAIEGGILNPKGRQLSRDLPERLKPRN